MPEQPKVAPAAAWCPRCDKPFFGKSHVGAMRRMREHLAKCCPEMLDATRD